MKEVQLQQALLLLLLFSLGCGSRVEKEKVRKESFQDIISAFDIEERFLNYYDTTLQGENIGIVYSDHYGEGYVFQNGKYINKIPSENWTFFNPHTITDLTKDGSLDLVFYHGVDGGRVSAPISSIIVVKDILEKGDITEVLNQPIEEVYFLHDEQMNEVGVDTIYSLDFNLSEDTLIFTGEMKARKGKFKYVWDTDSESFFMY